MRPNWFLAIPLDGAFVDRLPAVPTNFRRFHAEDMHLTVAFLGGCGEERALRGLESLSALLEAHPLAAFELSLGRVVPMGPRGRYSALSALLEDGRDEAEQLLRTLRDPILEAATGRGEDREPKPHVTLARPQGRARHDDRAAGRAWADALELGSIRLRASQIALYTWNELRRERLFRVVAARSLA